MNRMVLLSIAACALFAFAACGGGGGSAPAPYDGPTTIPYDGPGGGLDGGTGGGGSGGGLSWRVLDSGTMSRIQVSQTSVARNDADYGSLWIAHRGPIPGSKMPEVPPPPVDFATETVVAVFLGDRPSSGYSVRITDIVPEADGVRVSAEESQPNPNAIVETLITQPCVFVAVTRFAGTAEFDLTTVVRPAP